MFSICSEYEAIKQRALTKPATTAELNDIIKYIDNAKGEKSLQLAQRIKVCCYLLIEMKREKKIILGSSKTNGISFRRISLFR